MLFNIGRGVGGFGPVVVGAIAAAYSVRDRDRAAGGALLLDILAMWLLIPERRGAALT